MDEKTTRFQKFVSIRTHITCSKNYLATRFVSVKYWINNSQQTKLNENKLNETSLSNNETIETRLKKRS